MNKQNRNRLIDTHDILTVATLEGDLGERVKEVNVLRSTKWTARWLSWLERHTIHPKVAGLNPGHHTCVVGSIPSWGMYGRQPINASLSH